jgi:long-chain fatty acid transport protein
LASGLVGTPYQINSGTSTGYVIGAAYSIPDIALRAELLYQPSSALTTDGTFAGAALTASLKRPETLTLNFQTGIAEGTLLTASVHNAKWSAAPVTVDTVVDVADINETFDDSTKYSVGLARKLSNKWAISAGYSREEGGGSEASSLFTISNGSQAFSLGARYTLSENMDISFGVSHSIFGDVTVNNVGARTAIAQAGYDLANGAGSFAAADAATQAAVLGTINPINYENNTATTFGVKLGISF